MGKVSLNKATKKGETLKKKEISKSKKNPKKSVIALPKPLIEKNAEDKSGNDHKEDVSSISVAPKQIKAALKAVLKLIQSDEENHKRLLDAENQIFIQLTVIKVPRAIPRTLRISLPNTRINNLSDVCLIVPNLKRDKPKEVDETIDSYKELLKSKGVENVKEILPLYKLKTEYSQYEMKRRLVELYDTFLVDGRISFTVMKFLGKIFIEKRKQPIPVRLEKPNLKDEFEKSLSKTTMNVHSRGDNFLSIVGNDKMTIEELAENVSAFIENIQNVFPGGSKNIRAFNLKGSNTPAVPIYYSLGMINDFFLQINQTLEMHLMFVLANKNEVPNVRESPRLPKYYKVCRDELSTKNNSDVSVYPDGRVKTHRLPTENGR